MNQPEIGSCFLIGRRSQIVPCFVLLEGSDAAAGGQIWGVFLGRLMLWSAVSFLLWEESIGKLSGHYL